MTIIDNQSDEPLPRHVNQVLKAMFDGYQRVVVRRKLAGGLSGSLVYLLRPFPTVGPPELPSIVKVDYFDRIAAEWNAYQNCIGRRMPQIAEIQQEPTYLPDSLHGGLWYPLVGAGTFNIVSLREYYLQAELADLRYVLEEQLFPSLNQVWQYATTEPEMHFGRQYDDFLPPHLQVCVRSPEREVRIHSIHPKNAHKKTYHTGDWVKVIGFHVIKVYRGDDPGLGLDYPADMLERYRIRLTGLADVGEYKVSDVLTQPLVGQVEATRMNVLKEAVQESIGAAVDLDQETIPVGQEQLPNPLIVLPQVLNQSRISRLSCLHGDLNLENVMVQTEIRQANLIDFALSGQYHVIRDLLHLELAIVTHLIPYALQQTQQTPSIITDFYRRLHCALQTSNQSAPAGLEKPFQTLLTIRQAANNYQLLHGGWVEYYHGLFLYLVGALRFGDLTRLKSAPWPRQIAFYGAAAVYDLLNNPPTCIEKESGMNNEEYQRFRNKLLDHLHQCFNMSELKVLCFRLNVPYENLAGDTKQDKMRELIEYLERRGRLDELIQYCKAQRPNIDWEVIIERWVDKLLPLNPPPPPELFVNREEILKHLTTSIVNHRGGVFSIAGLGGVGKTALAALIAQRIKEDVAIEVLWVSLEAHPEARDVWRSIVRRYSRENIYTDIESKALNYLSEHRPLVIIDNAESAPQVAEELIKNRKERGEATILVTTRDRGIVSGHLDQSEDQKSLGQLPPEDAKRLFVDRTNSPEDPALIEEFCQMLGYLPLAIELAIGCMVAYENEPLDDFLFRLENSPLGEVLKDVKRHEQSVAFTFNLTLDKLTAETQNVLTAIALDFGRTTSRTAIAAALNIDRLEAINHCNDLLLYSLINRNAQDKHRYEMHPLLKRHIREQIDELEASMMREGLAAHYLKYVKGCQGLTPENILAIEVEWTNIRNAINWAVEQKDSSKIVEFPFYLRHFFEARGYWEEGAAWLSEALQATNTDYKNENLTDIQVKLQLTLGWLLYRLGKHDQAIAQFEACLQKGDTLSKTMALRNWGVVLKNGKGEFSQAYKILKQSLESAEKLDANSDEYGREIIMSEMELGECCTRLAKTIRESDQEDKALRYHEEAQQYLKRALGRYEEMGLEDKQLEANLYQCRGIDYHIQGNLDEALADYQKAADLSGRVGLRSLSAESESNVGEIYKEQGQTAKARFHLNKAKQLAEEIGYIALLQYLENEYGNLTSDQIGIVNLEVNIDFYQFTLEEQSQFIVDLSHIIDINPDDICILDVAPGSVLITLEMPEEAAATLVSMLLTDGSDLMTLPITRIERIELIRNSIRVDNRSRNSVTTAIERVNPAKLREFTANYFNETELRDLCHDLGVDYENLPGQGKRDKARELVAFLARRGRVDDLISICCHVRPNIPVTDLVSD